MKAGFPQIQLLESWRIDKPTVADDRIFDGVQLDTQGRVLGYWLDGSTACSTPTRWFTCSTSNATPSTGG